MLKWLHQVLSFQFSEQLDIIDFIGKHFLVENADGSVLVKMTELSITKVIVKYISWLSFSFQLKLVISARFQKQSPRGFL